MSEHAIAIKYGTHQPETALATLPLEEALEVITAHLREEVRAEVDSEFDDRISDAENEASEWESRADEYKDEASQMAQAINEALNAESLDDVKIILERTKSDHRSYF